MSVCEGAGFGAYNVRKLAFALVFIFLTVCFAASAPSGEQTLSRATLAPSLELRSVDGTDVPFQNGVPYPSFERQKDRLVEDLGGAWKFRSLPSTDSEIGKSLSERNEITLALLENNGYHSKNFNDSSWGTRNLPACENPIGAPVDENVYWYRRVIRGISNMRGKYVKLVFLGSNYITDVWVNGSYVGWHEGGYTSFVFDVTDYLNYDDSDVIAVRVHNIPWDIRSEQMDIVPYQTCDFRNHGGIYRDIYLEATETLNIARVDVKPSLKFSGEALLENSGHIEVSVVVHNRDAVSSSATVSLSVYRTSIDNVNLLDPAPEAIADFNSTVQTAGTAMLSSTVQGGGVSVLKFSLDLFGIELWTPKNPALYVLEASLNDGTDIFYTQFGVREIKVDGDYPRLLLNRVPTFLAGIARHEAMPDVFMKFTAEQMENLKRDLDMAKEANVDFIRTAHYPNHPYVHILADRMGFMIWEEMAATWFVDYAFGVHLERGVTQQMWLEMIYRDYNRPSIIIWGTTNEADIHQPEPAPGLSNRYRFNERMKELAYRVDGTRLVTQATFWNVDPTWPVDDILGINEYQGVFYYSWAPVIGDYYDQTRVALRNSHKTHPEKPIVASEMGTWSCEDMSRTSEQSRCFVDTFRALDEKPYVSGTVWWCLADWWQARGSAQTMGTVTWNRDLKKPVYYLIKEAYENTWTRPWVKILSPIDGEMVSETVEIEAIAEDYRGDQVGVARVEYSLDGGEYISMGTGGNGAWVATWDSREVPDGEHVITVRAVDLDGQIRLHSITLVTMNRFRWSQSDWSGDRIPAEFTADEDTVCFWKFERIRRGIVEDSSHNGNHGKVTDATLVDGRFGYGIKFENSDLDTNAASSVKITYNDSLNFVSGDFTVQFWVRPDVDYPSVVRPTSEKGWRMFIRQDNRLNGDWWDGCWWVGYDEWWDELAFVVRDAAGGEKKVAYRFSLDAGRWYNIAGVKEGKTLKLYVDGVLRAVGDAPEDYQPCGDLYVSYHRDNPSDPIFLTFNGVIDEMRIVKRALSDQEVAMCGAWAQLGSWEENYSNHSDSENVDTDIPGLIRLSIVGNKKPTAEFSYSPSLPTMVDSNNVVRFTDLSVDPDGTIVSWSWDFGDGTTSSERSPVHVYERDGVYSVMLTVTDDSGASDSMSDVVTVYWDVVMLQDFEPNNGTPEDYYYDAWSSSPRFETSVVFEGTRSLRMNARGSGGDPLFHGGGTVGIFVAFPEGQVNLQNADSIFMWVFDTQGNNTLELRLRDNTGAFGPAWWSNDHPVLGLSGIAVKDNWTKFAWDLSTYSDIDKSRIVGLELYEWWDGYYYFDSISVGIVSGFTVTSDLTVGRFSGGGVVNLSIKVERVGLYDREVELSCQGAPDGVTVAFSRERGVPDFESTATIAISSSTAPGIYPIKIFGIGEDGKVRSCIYNLVIGEKRFQDFEPGNGTMENYSYEVYYTTRDFSYRTVHGGLRSLEIRARARQGGSHGGAFGVNAASASGYLNIYNASVITAWIYDTVGNNTVELKVVDADNRVKNFGYSPGKSVKNRWTMLVWNVRGPSDNADMSRIKSLEFYVWWDGYYYFDDISYIEGSVSRTTSLENSSGSSGPGTAAALNSEISGLARPLFRSVSTEFDYTGAGLHSIIPQATSKSDYRPRGVLVSNVYDAGVKVYWGSVYWSAEVQPSTSVKVYTRAGDSKNPAEGGWSDWIEAGNGWDLPHQARYVQYMVVMETSDGKVTPFFNEITITYSLQESSLEFLPWLVAVAVVMAGAFLVWYWRRRRKNKDNWELG